MSLPTDRDSFKQWCLRRLGAPVINIEVADEQIDDAVDYSLQWYFDYHMDGTERSFYIYQLQQADITNQYITIPNEYIYIVDLFDIGDGFSTNNIFNLKYQLIMSDMYSMTLQQSIVPYYLIFQNLQFLEQLLVGHKPIRFNRRVGILHIDMDWTVNNVGDFIVIDAYKALDPTTNIKIWQDRWLMRYCTAQIKRQWGEQLSKYTVPLVGGQQFNGDKIKQEAMVEIASMEAEVINAYSLPPAMLLG